MSSVNTVQNQTLFFLPPPGKSSIDAKTGSIIQVVQKAQKGNTCWFYAQKLVRRVDPQNKSQEETLISLMRKCITNRDSLFAELHPMIAYSRHSIIHNAFSSFNVELPIKEKELLLQRCIDLESIVPGFDFDLEIFENFLRSADKKNLADYMAQYFEELDTPFLKAIDRIYSLQNTSLEIDFNNSQELYPPEKRSTWAGLSLNEKVTFALWFAP